MKFNELNASEMSEQIQAELSKLPTEVDLEYGRLSDGQWCVRTIPSEGSMRFAAIGGSIERALVRLRVMLHLHTM